MISHFGTYWTQTFLEVFPSADSFLTEYKTNNGFYADNLQRIEDSKVLIIYYLLYAEYGNNSFAAMDRERALHKMWSIVYRYAPSWLKKMDIQRSIRTLSATELIEGSKSINNLAYNDGTAPGTSTIEEILAINQQTTMRWAKSKVEGLANQYELINNDVTGTFIEKFRVLFLKTVYPQEPLLFEGDEI